MNNTWSFHQLKAAEHAKRAAIHYKKAAEYTDSGDLERAIHYACLAASDMDYSTQHAKQAFDYCFTKMINDTTEQ